MKQETFEEFLKERATMKVELKRFGKMVPEEVLNGKRKECTVL